MKRYRILFSIFLILTLLIRPLPVSAANKLDIVFIIDRSGSMGSSINNVKNQISDFTDLLEGQGISYRLGLVTYEDDVTVYPLTSNVNRFKRDLGRIDVSGGTENGLDAIYDAVNSYIFDISAAKYFVLIGDERIYSDYGRTENSIKNLLKNNNIILTSIGPNSSSDPAKSQLKSISDATGGLYLDLDSDFKDSLTSIFDQIQTIPTLDIVSPTPNQVISGLNTAFIPVVNVADPDSDRLTFSLYVDSETSPRQTKTVTNSTNSQMVSFDAMNMGGLVEGNHSLRFEVNDGTATVQEIVNFQIDKTPPQLGVTNVTATANSITMTGSATDARAGMNHLPYRYTVGTTSSNWTSLTSYTRGSLSPNTAYTTKFEARDKVELTSVKSQTVYTLAQIPSFTIQNQQTDSLELLFNDNNPGTTQYQVKVGSKYVSSTGTLTTTPTWITATERRVTIKGLSANTSYLIEGKARNHAGIETNYSPRVTGITIGDPPKNITLDSSQTSVTISWSPVVGATGYDVEADGIIVDNGNLTTYIHQNLIPNTQHQYRVRLKNGGGTGNWSSLYSITTLPYPPASPENLNLIPSQRSIQLEWDSVPNADSYEVEANGSIIYSGDQTSYLYQQLTPKTSYSFRIRGVNRGGAGEWSQEYSIDTLPDPPTEPVNITTNITKDSVRVQWPSVEGATAYEIEVDGLILENEDNTFYLHESLLPLSGHTYRVRAKNSGGKSPWSVAINVTTHPEAPVVPTNIMTTSDSSSINLTWYQVAYAESYEIEIDGVTVVNVEDTIFTHSGLNTNDQHSYRVRARNISGVSPWSKPVTMSTMGDEAVALTNLVAVVTNHSIMLSWDAVAYDNRFEIEVDGVLMDNDQNTTYNHTGLQAEEYHTYKIRVKDQTGDPQWYVVLSLATLPNPPDAPGEIEAFATDTSIELRWDRVEGATGYDIEVNGTVLDNGTLESYIHDQLTPATTYYYRIRAKNMTGVTAWSPLLSKSTTSPTYVVDGKLEENFEMSLLAYHVQDFSQMTFVVTYDPDEVEVVDLYGFTIEEESLITGVIPGTNIEVNHTEGRIEYRVQQSVLPGTSWTGEISGIIFKSKIDGEINIDFILE
ncbi:VWA domain-containing protein [Alkaliphilus pronyensis]|uniref:VWA domain-containing protein n=1 Tax=Alkaliphilus pronyensis TaxID=1482732 RepID=A0A6I0F9H8_9FIRM|nr:fibronectin type III domain-containing protein [Alkaliphilus pronyensis]KAB3535453.1 VWA domain-containing protein [Alkaliphilus pronyensis]